MDRSATPPKEDGRHSEEICETGETVRIQTNQRLMGDRRWDKRYFPQTDCYCSYAYHSVTYLTLFKTSAKNTEVIPCHADNRHFLTISGYFAGRTAVCSDYARDIHFLPMQGRFCNILGEMCRYCFR